LRTRIAELADHAAEEIMVCRAQRRHQEDLADRRVRMARRDGHRFAIEHLYSRRRSGGALQIGLERGALLRARLVGQLIGRLVGAAFARLRSHRRLRGRFGAARTREGHASAPAAA
jgi:hypothetical protein